MAQLPTGVDYHGLSAIQQYCYEMAGEKGFHEEGDRLRDEAAPDINGVVSTEAASNLRNYYANRIMLIVSEPVEAHDELRSGKAMDEEYFNKTPGKEGKPEGIPSELVDALIRILDLFGEINVDSAAVLKSKTDYNASRERLHGRQF